MRFAKPETIPLLFIIGATLLLGGLGAWQVERLQWKNAMLVSIEEAQHAPPIKILPKLLDGLDYRAVELTGTFAHAKHLYEVSGPRGGQPGFFVLTPFKLNDGRVVLVNRGWSPKGKESMPIGARTVKGILRPLRKKRYFSPDNQPDLWFYEDIDAMSKYTGLTLLPFIVEEVGPYKTGAYPAPSDGKIALRNDHLSYAITWFSLAIIGLIMFAIYHRKKP